MMLKDQAEITLYPDEIFRLTSILVAEDRNAALAILVDVIKKKVDAVTDPVAGLF